MLNPRRVVNLAIVSAATLMVVGCANVVRVAPHTELSVIDPIWTTAYITRNHGYLVYDTLFAFDENSDLQPQMVEKWSLSDDKKEWTFVLRDGLKWHDGTNVTAEDCVASLQRWAKRDGVGQEIFKNLVAISAGDAKTFSMKFLRPTDYVPEVLAKGAVNVPFMMPKRVAQTDPFSPIQDVIGSGPFVYSQSRSVKGEKTVYEKNEDYVPRSEPSSLAAGGKLAKADRIEWIYFPDRDAAVTALIEGDVDYVESVSTKLAGRLEGVENITLASTDPLGNMAMVRFNSTIPPFDKVGVRHAVLKAVQQEDYMTAALGDAQFWRVCYSVFPCGTPLSSDAESDQMKPAADMNAVKKLLEDAGYDGVPIVILNPVDSPVIAALTKVTVDKLRSLGMNVQTQDMTWAELTKRRADPSGWNMFHTWWLAADVADPTSIVFSGDPERGWYGWPKDPALEELRASFMQAGPDERKRIAGAVQKRVVEMGYFGVLGQFFEPVAYRSNVGGITSPVQYYWNMFIEKKKK